MMRAVITFVLCAACYHMGEMTGRFAGYSLAAQDLDQVLRVSYRLVDVTVPRCLRGR